MKRRTPEVKHALTRLLIKKSPPNAPQIIVNQSFDRGNPNSKTGLSRYQGQKKDENFFTEVMTKKI